MDDPVFLRGRASSTAPPGSTALPPLLFFLALIIFSIFADLPLIVTKEQPRPQVNLHYATYKGVALHDGVDQYTGMRYAAPPVANLRWRAPRDPPELEGAQDASKLGSVCYGTNRGSSYRNDEDCLFVNVWAPSGANETSKLPVWVYIQGGGYTANSNPDYNGTAVVKESGGNVIFVNFNYRVGLFGFLADERVREDGDLNVGLLDQRHLFLWVKKHISKFGGDPDHVVIHGLSAGRGSVALQLAAYGGRDDDLFVGAVSQSLFVRRRTADLLQGPVELPGQVLDPGVRGDDQMKCLRGLSTRTLQEVGNVSGPFQGRSSDPKWYWTPSVDGDLIEDYPSVMFESGKFVKVPVMMGTATNEGSIFAANAITADGFTGFMKNNYPNLSDNNTDEMVEHYPEQDPVPRHFAWFPSTSDAYTDSTFVCPTNHVLDSFSAAGSSNETWSYHYDVFDEVSSASGKGVEHTFDRAAIHGPASIPDAPASYLSYNAPMVPLMMNYYLSFVRALDPNVYRAEGAPEWGTWRDGERMRFELGASRMETAGKGQRERCEFWGGIAGNLDH